MPLWMALVLLIICIGGMAYCIKGYLKCKKPWFLAQAVVVALLAMGLLAYFILALILVDGVR